MKISSIVIRLSIFIVFLKCPVLAGEHRKSISSPEQQFLLKSEQHLDRVFLLSGNSLTSRLSRALFDPEPFEDKAENLMKKGPKPLRPHAASLLAKLRLLAHKDPVGALLTVGPFLIEREAFKRWRASFEEEKKKALADWKQECREARKERLELPARPVNQLFAPFPSPSNWRPTPDNFRCSIAAGLALLRLNRRSNALLIFKTVGQKHRDGLGAILAEEGAGDAFMAPTFYAKAIGLYEHALKLCRHCIRYLEIDSSGEIRHLQRRIEFKLVEARRMADIERYGPGYVAYRHCQKLRYAEQYLFAHLAYGKLKKDFPQTVFAAAADAYRIKCSFALSEKEHEKKAKAAVAKAEAAYKKAENAFNRAKKQNPLRKDRVKRKLLSAMFRERLEALDQMRGVATGKRAVQAAERDATALLRDEFNLYRGEVLVDLATYSFESELRANKAEQRYMRAWEWLAKVEEIDAELDAYEVPDKARKVSAPPRQEMKIDRMGNISNEQIDPTMIMNRKTCSWYLNDLREQCALAIGFMHFVKKDNQTALRWYAKVPELDQATNMLARKGEWTNYTRLKWGAEHGYLNAYPEELKIYKKRLRFVLLMADFYYCTQRFERAREIATRLLSGEFGRLDAKQDDYPQFLLATCKHWERDRKGAYLLCKEVLDEKEWTITQHRAAFTAANLSWYVPDEKIMKEGMALLRKMAASKKKTPYVYRSRLVLAMRLLQLGELKEGARMLSSVPEKASGYHIVAERYLKALEKFKQTVKDKEKGEG